MAKYYRLYGLTVLSDAELDEAEEVQAVAVPDAVIKLELPPEWVVKEYKEEGKFSSLSEQCSWFRVYDEILIYVENGNYASVWVLNEKLNKTYINSYVLSGVFTFLMFQRGYVVIHGSAIEYNGSVFIVSGPSGSGKSTTAAELLKDSRFRFASDDLSAIRIIDGKCFLFPGPPWQKLLPDAHERQQDAEDKDCVFLDECGGKFAKRLKKGYINHPVEVKNIFYVSKSDREDILFRRIVGIEALDHLTHNLFRGEIITALGITPERFSSYLNIVSKTNIYSIERPVNKNTIDELTEKISNIVLI